MENQHNHHHGHQEHKGHDHAAMQTLEHAHHKQEDEHNGQDEHAGHHTADFLKGFWLCLALTIPVLLLSHMIRQWIGFKLSFAGDKYLLLALSSFI
ncbi:hypothetical protein [Paraflavitalea speifideaquila]|uniref:hypothetical protein n=1 Tax=Paraflavitalea speifideaquila TaxID=3076558 RepID=UPI0028EE52FC|nr:hypothetical protein [Paraflavitalea speifideiaquila]